MEDRRRRLKGSERIGTVLIVASVLGLAAVPAYAEPLGQRIPGLFGGNLNTTICPRCVSEAQPNPVRQLFSTLTADLALFYSEAPVPSASGAFGFEKHPELEAGFQFINKGPGLADRAPTLGEHFGVIGVSYTHIDFDTLEGQPLDRLTFTQPALSQAYLAQLPQQDRMRAQDDLRQTHLDFHLTMDQFFITGAYGLTESVDVSVALSLVRIQMRAAAEADIVDGSNNGLGASFAPNQPGVCLGDFPFRCARDGFDDSAFGTGDVFLRGKWHFYDTKYADLAVAGVLTIPTGNADDFLGFHDPTFTPWLIASKHLGRFEPHLNIGYAFRTHRDVSQAEWIAGTDFAAFKWLTLNADFLGFHDDKRDGINDDVLQSAVGFKITPRAMWPAGSRVRWWRRHLSRMVVAGDFQFPLNRDGLRADVIYTGQVEYTF